MTINTVHTTNAEADIPEPDILSISNQLKKKVSQWRVNEDSYPTRSETASGFGCRAAGRFEWQEPLPAPSVSNLEHHHRLLSSSSWISVSVVSVGSIIPHLSLEYTNMEYQCHFIFASILLLRQRK
jgi:hypothetical protein